MIPTKNDMDIWVHVSPDQKVWFGTDTHPAVDSEQSPEDFAELDWVQSGQAIRLLGDWDNADLITRLWNIKLKRELPLTIYLAKPQRNAENAEQTVAQMRQLTNPPSCGGWHAMQSNEYASYSLIAHLMREEPEEMTDVGYKLLDAHLAAPVLSFLPECDCLSAAYLLAFIIDPRWHVDPLNPDRSAAYYWFLGLGHQESSEWVLDAYNRQRTGTSESDYRNVAPLVQTWATEGLLDRYDPVQPESFLCRIVRRDEHLAKGILKASKVFAKLIRDVWLDRMTASRVYIRYDDPSKPPRLVNADKPSRELFVPEHFFEEVSVVEAWKEHILSVD